MKRTRVREGSADRGRNATRPHAPPASGVISSMHTTISSPIGPLRLAVADDGAVTRIDFGAGDVSDDPRFAPLAAELAEYFAGERTAFDLPLRPRGSAFEQLVWAELLRIPYGETASYGEIA